MKLSKEQFEQLYRRCFPKALGLAVSLLHDQDLSRDLVQDVFVRIWELDEDITNIEAFVYRSVRNACINQMNSLSTKERFERFYPIEMELLDEFDLEEAQRLREVSCKLLSPREKQVLEAIFDQGQSYKEAAKRFDISVSTVNKHIVNALKTLRNHFKTVKS